MADDAREPLTREAFPLVQIPAEEGGLCIACGGFLAVGTPACGILLGPGDDPEQRFRARRGWSYSGPSAVIHWACATGFEGPDERGPLDLPIDDPQCALTRSD